VVLGFALKNKRLTKFIYFTELPTHSFCVQKASTRFVAQVSTKNNHHIINLLSNVVRKIKVNRVNRKRLLLFKCKYYKQLSFKYDTRV